MGELDQGTKRSRTVGEFISETSPIAFLARSGSGEDSDGGTGSGAEMAGPSACARTALSLLRTLPMWTCPSSGRKFSSPRLSAKTNRLARSDGFWRRHEGVAGTIEAGRKLISRVEE